MTSIAAGGTLEIFGRSYATTATTFMIQGALELKSKQAYGFSLAAGATSHLVVQSGGKIELEGTSGLNLATGTRGFLSIAGGGRLEKVFAGTSTVGIATNNGGEIIPKGGQLDIAGAVIGAGRDIVKRGATLQFDQAVTAAQAVSFATGGGVLHLADAPQFAGTIAKLGTGDTIDVDGLGAGTSFTYDANAENTGGTLALTNGSTVDRLNLVGSYAASGFHLATGSSGDTRVTYAAPTADHETPSPAATLGRSLFEAALADAGAATVPPAPPADAAPPWVAAGAAVGPHPHA